MAKGDKNAPATADDAANPADAVVTEVTGDVKTEAEGVVAKVEGFIAKAEAQAKAAITAEAHAALLAAHNALADARAKVAAAVEHAEGDLKDFLAKLQSHL